MKTISTLVVFSFLLYFPLQSQDAIEWSEDYLLSTRDFQATAPNLGDIQTVNGQSIIEYQFTNYQLLFSNLNKIVTCKFLPSSSWIDEGEFTKELLRYAQLLWDLNELSARKLRKRFNENRLSLNASTAEAYFQEISKEITQIQSQYTKETNVGKNEEGQIEWEQKIADLLAEYADYCKSCKPPKKKKKKK